MGFPSLKEYLEAEYNYIKDNTVLLYHWEHRGITMPLLRIKYSDIQILRKLSKTQTWECSTVSAYPTVGLSHCLVQG